MMTTLGGRELSRARRSSPLVKVVTTFVVLCCGNLAVTCAANYNVKECFDGSESDPPGNVTLDCPDGDVISIDEALFGRNKWLACVITEGDCTEKTRIFQNCEGLNNCTRTFKTYSPKCGYISVLLLSYNCVQSYYTPVVTTPISTDERNYIWEGQPAEGTIASPTQQPKSSDDGPNEIGLIVGCVVAAIVTVIALIIAIIMVIRRLLQYHRKDRSSAASDAEEPRSGNGFTCMDHLSCCNPSQSNSHSEHDMIKMKKATSASASGHSTGKGPGKTRMAPVGQESSTHDLTGQSEAANASSSANRNAMTTNESTPRCADYCESDQNMCNNSGDVFDSSSNAKASFSRATLAKYGINENQGIPAELKQSQAADAKNNNDDQKKISMKDINYLSNMLHNNISQSKASIEKEDNFSQNMKAEPGDTSSSKHGTRPEAGNHGSGEKHTQGKGPKYDAVAIPNTEQGTAC